MATWIKLHQGWQSYEAMKTKTKVNRKNNNKEKSHVAKHSIQWGRLRVWQQCSISKVQTEQCHALTTPQLVMQTFVLYFSNWTTKAKKWPNPDHSKVNQNCMKRTKRQRVWKGETNVKPGHVLKFTPTIPLLIIQSNFGEELRVEAGLPSFTYRQISFRRKTNKVTHTQACSSDIMYSTWCSVIYKKTQDFTYACCLK